MKPSMLKGAVTAVVATAYTVFLPPTATALVFGDVQFT